MIKLKIGRKKYIITFKGEWVKKYGKFRTKGAAYSIVQSQPLSVRKDYEIKPI